MGNVTVKFIGKEYNLPEDLLVYIELLAMAEDIKKILYKDFLEKLSGEELACVGDEQLHPEIVRQVGKYVTMLTDKGIYDRMKKRINKE